MAAKSIALRARLDFLYPGRFTAVINQAAFADSHTGLHYTYSQVDQQLRRHGNLEKILVPKTQPPAGLTLAAIKSGDLGWLQMPAQPFSGNGWAGPGDDLMASLTGMVAWPVDLSDLRTDPLKHYPIPDGLGCGETVKLQDFLYGRPQQGDAPVGQHAAGDSTADTGPLGTG